MAVWLERSLQVVFRMVRNKEMVEFEIRPTPQEMRASSSLSQANSTFGPHLKGVVALNDSVPIPRAS